ncbi:MAG: hypothetical protein QOI20_3282 [Acidimicrobiaceae bacterium]|jgi:hypothetical protein|nr:hypothetical protein [Acidimicrobiaceae bacterium]
MSLLVKSDFVSLQSALETTLGVQATAGYRRHQPNGGGLSDFYAKLKRVSSEPLSIMLQREKGAVVGLESAPKVTQDLNKELLEAFWEGIFRSATKYPGGTGVGRFVPTSFTATAIGVPAGGALPQGAILWIRGTTLNNGLKVVGAGSTAGSIAITGGTIETPPATAVVEVVGYQGASGDIGVNAAGNLTSAANAFAGLGLLPGWWVWVGGGTAAAPGALGFTVAAQNRGFARITGVAAGVITVDRKNQAWATDPGTGKTIQLFFGPWVRNVFGDSADYKEPSYTLEIGYPGAAAAGATSYAYALGALVNTFEINAPSEDKITAAVSFAATDFTDPSTVRATGAAAAPTPVQTALFTTASQVRRLRVSNTDETGISTDILDWKLTVNNNVKPQVQQGTLGAKRIITGRFDVSLDVTCIFTQDDVCKAIRDNRTCAFDVAIASTDGAVLFDVPSLTLGDGGPDIAANEAVKLPASIEAFRDTTYNFSLGMTVFPYLPAS